MGTGSPGTWRVGPATLLLLFAILGSAGVPPVTAHSAASPAAVPIITATTPADGSLQVRLNTTLEVRFSEPMDESSVRNATTPSIPFGAPSWSGGGTVLSLQPLFDLANCTTYRVDVSGTNVTGTSLQAYPWSFMTVCDRPFIVRTVPADGATNVPADAAIVVTFSQPMRSVAIALFPSPPQIDQTSDVNRLVFTFTFPVKFDPLTRYRATVSGSDDAGRALVASLAPNPWNFTTNEPPRIGGPLVAPGECFYGGATLTVNWTISDELDPPENLTVRLAYLNASGQWETFAGPAQGFFGFTSYPWVLPAEEVTTKVRVDVNDSAGEITTNTSKWFRIEPGSPFVLSTDPNDLATNVQVDALVSIVFSQPMNESLVEAAITTVPSFGGVSYNWTAGGRKVTLNVTGGLQARTAYNVTVASSARDACGGRALSSSKRFTFTTGKIPSAPPGGLNAAAIDETSVTIRWNRVTTFRNGALIPEGLAISYVVYRGANATDAGLRVSETGDTTFSDRGLNPSTAYAYRVVAVVDGVPSLPSTALPVRTRDPFLSTSEGRLSLAALAGAVGVAFLVWGQRRRKPREAEDRPPAAEIEDIVSRVQALDAEPNPDGRKAGEAELRARVRSFVGKVRDPDRGFDPRRDGLYRALAQALLKTPGFDLARGRQIADKRLGPSAVDFQSRGVAYRLLSEAEAGADSKRFEGLPEPGRRALLLLYFYALEEYLNRRMRALVPPGVKLVPAKRRRGEAPAGEGTWSPKSLCGLGALVDRNRPVFAKSAARWAAEASPVLREAAKARARAADPSHELPEPDEVRKLVYRAFRAIDPVLRKKPRARSKRAGGSPPSERGPRPS